MACGFFVINTRPSQEVVFSEIVNLLNNRLGKKKGTHSKGWKSTENCIGYFQTTSLASE
jgi:hypothetical protein